MLAPTHRSDLETLWRILYPAVDLSWGHFRFELAALGRVVLPGFWGSTLRGVFGNIFRDLVCSTKIDDCRTCPIFSECAFPRYFMTSPKPGQPLQALQDVPRPYVFRVGPPTQGHRTVLPGEKIPFELLLIGQGIEAFPYFLGAFRELARCGLGKGRAGAVLDRVDLIEDDGDSSSIYSRESSVVSMPSGVSGWSSLLQRVAFTRNRRELRIRFVTPVRFKVDNDWLHPGSELTFVKFMRVLLRRLSSLWAFAGEGRLDWDFASILQRAQAVRTTFQSLHHLPWRRHSSRTDNWVEMGGLLGEVCYQGDLDEFSPLIELGSLVHLGKNTTFGLGRYQSTWRCA